MKYHQYDPYGTNISVKPNTSYTQNSIWNTVNTHSPYQISTSDNNISTEFYMNYDELAINKMNELIQEIFIETNGDIESITMKEIFDKIVKNKPSNIEHVPQTVERCILALHNEWSLSIIKKIKLPFTGELHKEYLKLKLIYGSVK